MSLHPPSLSAHVRMQGQIRKGAPGACAQLACPLFPVTVISIALLCYQAISNPAPVSRRDTQLRPPAFPPCRGQRPLALLVGLARGAHGLVRLPPRVEAQPGDLHR